MSERKAQVREAFAKRLNTLALLLRDVATQQQLTQVQQFVQSIRTRLAHDSVASSLAFARELLEMAMTYRTEIEAMSKGQQIMEDAEEALEEFANMGLKPSRNRMEYSQHYRYFVERLQQAMIFINTSLLAFMAAWEEDESQTVALFYDHLNVPNYGKRYERDEEEGEEQEEEVSGDQGATSEDESGSDAVVMKFSSNKKSSTPRAKSA